MNLQLEQLGSAMRIVPFEPQRRVVEIYRRGEAEPTTLNAPNSVAGETTVAGFVLELESIWGKG